VLANIRRTVNRRTHNAFSKQSHYGTPTMPRGDKSKYTDKQDRKADHIAESYEQRGVPEEEAERRAWATVNKESGGGNKSGSGRGVPDSHVSSRKGGVSAVTPPPHALPRHVRRPRRKLPRPGSGTPSVTPTEGARPERFA
jgi:plasmid stabilization system protein ParE